MCLSPTSSISPSPQICISNRVNELSVFHFSTQFCTSTPPAQTYYVSIPLLSLSHTHTHKHTHTLCAKHLEKFWSQHLENFQLQHLEKFWSQHLENFQLQHLENQDWLQVKNLAQSKLAKCCCIFINTCCIIITIVPLFVITYTFCSVFDCNILVQNILNKITQPFTITQKSQRGPEQEHCQRNTLTKEHSIFVALSHCSKVKQVYERSPNAWPLIYCLTVSKINSVKK